MLLPYIWWTTGRTSGVARRLAIPAGVVAALLPSALGSLAIPVAAWEPPALHGHVRYEMFHYPAPRRDPSQLEDFIEILVRTQGRVDPTLTYQLETALVADDADFTEGAFSWRNEQRDRPFLALRQATLEYRPDVAVRIRAGKQVVDWSVFDEVQPANVMAPMEGSDPFRREAAGTYAASALIERGNFSVELAVMPFVFVLPRFPQGRWNILDAKVTEIQDAPAVEADETQAGLRIGATVGPLDLAAIGYVGRDWAAVFEPELVFVGGEDRFRLEITNRYPRLRAGGFNATLPLGDITLLRTELMYYSSPDEIRDDFFLSGIGAEVTWDDWRANLNYLRNDLVDHAAVEVTDKGERFFVESFLTGELRWDRGGRCEAWLRGGYDFTLRFYVVQPEVSCTVVGDLRATLSADIIDGESFGYFERVRHEDRIGTRFQYNF